MSDFALQRAFLPHAVRLDSDASGGWILSGPGCPRRRFHDLEAALDGARQVAAAETAVIELWRAGEYVCCVPARPLHKNSTRANPAPRDDDAFAAVERSVHRAAQFLMTVAGALFWLAIAGAALVASVGWRVAWP